MNRLPRYLLLLSFLVLCRAPALAAPEASRDSRHSRPSLDTERTDSIDEIAAYLRDISTRPLPIRDRRALAADRKPQKLPEIPAAYRELPPVKLGLRIRLKTADGVKTMERTLVRTTDTIYMRYEHQGQEWLFQQNPIDPRRLSGKLVDHRKRSILQYYQSELHEFGIVSSWRDVFLLGVDPDLLALLEPTGGSETLAGVQFRHFVNKTDGASQPSTEIWWSDSAALPLRIIQRKDNEEWIQEIASIEWTRDEALLAEPHSRFPQYAEMDYVDWQEEAHESFHEGVAKLGHAH